MEVRLARYDDITHTVLFLRDQHAMSVFKEVPFNPAMMRKNLREIIKLENSDVLLAISREGKIKGALIAWAEAMVWTHRRIATDIHFVADAGGDKLLRAFKQWALTKGCSEICMGTFNQMNEERIEKLYNRIGLATVGKTYRMELVK